VTADRARQLIIFFVPSVKRFHFDKHLNGQSLEKIFDVGICS